MSMKFSSIPNERLSDKVINQIMDNIKSGELEPGARLPSEPELAFSLGVSRGILREALTILQARKIIYRKPKEGTFIAQDVMDVIRGSREISVKEATVMDLIEVRESFEAKVVEKVIALASDEEIEELMELVQNPVERGSEHSPDYYFHYRLAELSRNIVFVNFIDMYYDVIDELKTKSSRQKKRLEEINEEHRRIVEAIMERDTEKARERMNYHLYKVKEHAAANETESNGNIHSTVE
ncbi:FadR/GntR family transcriptional regulator [Murimonas intestini]|uniref:GntR family transcriptional regulator n=1 Tax=Murimonas intestini TaxID=1337051 RepID=A0AB73SYA9_9FIRM|nr:FadR/GntR family transcriptional regulator [Murimonas intestini]MCR1842250.1 FadR family transcriptional regulator [Murimonas intestini]MCR1868331.1 FadR family transcriptional regulator [Murimonas intestini]MCR1885775.1 FadR family transcriptional regulator [Murimonas intestini]